MKISFKTRSIKIANLCQKISKIIIYSLTFLLPIFFLPLTLDVLDFNKQILLIILVSLALLFWLVKILISDKVEFNFSFLNVPVLIFFLIYGFSTIFSQWSYGSFWGWPLNISQGFLTLLYFLVFYVLIANIFTKKRDIFRLLFLFVISGALVALFSIFQIFGKFLLPWNFAKLTSFNTIGTLNSLSIFIAFLLPLAISLTFLAERLIKRILIISLFIFLFLLILVNFWTAWIVLISGTLILFIFGIFNLRETGQIDLIWLPMLLLIISLFFLVFRISLVQIPIEISPTQRTELGIAKSVLSKNFFLGTGPTTFIFSYLKFKPIEINQTVFWNIRFTSGASEVLDKLITTGVLGISALFFIFGVFFWLGLRYLKGKTAFSKGDKDSLLPLGVFSSFFGLVFSQFLYSANLTWLFFFWLLLGVFIALFPKIKSRVFKSLPLVLVGLCVLIFLLGIGLSFVGFGHHLAEMKYLQGLKAWEQGQSGQAIDYLKKAIDLNPGLDSYWRDLSQLYLVRLNEILPKEDLPPEAIGNLINNLLDSSRKATELSPKNVSNWNVRAFIYQNLAGLVKGAEDWAITNYQKAADLEPKNPYIFTEIGKIYLSKADISAQLENEEEMTKNLAQAQENFQKALELKSDYAPAHFQIAMIYVREGKTREAIEKLEATKLVTPFNDIGLAFQLGLLYYNDNQSNKALTEFERAVSIDENYSNARYFLGLIHDRQGNQDKAIEQFERIEELNPDNLAVKRVLANLREGLPALEGIQPPELPIEERPSEIEK
ncbi:tetratricopeptide repeat protein [Patescibacteria group bacterium]|nr:tetratricopeptide repeat protein [Patescibacteria group bacterium]